MTGESWQDWRNPKFREFLVEFYRKQLNMAFDVTRCFDDKDMTDTTLAVFEKIAPPAVYLIAPPAVYLKAEYDAWLHGSEEDLPDSATRVKAETKPLAQHTPPKGVTAEGPSKLDEVLRGLELRLREELLFGDVGEETRITLKRFLPDRNDWLTINTYLREEGFQWTKNGREGYWRR